MSELLDSWEHLGDGERDDLLRRAFQRRDIFTDEEMSGFMAKCLERWPHLSQPERGMAMRRAVGQRSKPHSSWLPAQNIQHAWDAVEVVRHRGPEAMKRFNRNLRGEISRRVTAGHAGRRKFDPADLFLVTADAICVAALMTLREDLQ